MRSACMPWMRLKLDVNEPTLLRPTSAQIRATEWSVVRSSAAARSIRRVSRYWCGVSPNARRKPRTKCQRDACAARCKRVDVERLDVARVDHVAGAQQVAVWRDRRHRPEAIAGACPQGPSVDSVRPGGFACLSP